MAKANTGNSKDVAENFIKRYIEPYIEPNQLRSQAEIERCLKIHLPEWVQRPFCSIKRSDVTLPLEKIVDNHGARRADSCLAIIRKLMNWYAT